MDGDNEIFRNRKGDQPILFYIIPCKRKAAISKAIKDHGGEMALQRREARYLLYNPGDIVSDAAMVSTAYIDDCISQGKLLTVEDYRYSAQQKKDSQEKRRQKKKDEAKFAFDEPASSSSQAPRASQRQSGYTITEDKAIIEAVVKLSKHQSINGNKLWDMMVNQKVTGRTSSSMKERFIKKILPFIDNYDISDGELRKLKTLQSSKSYKVAKSNGAVQKREQLPFLRAPRPVKPPSTFDLSSSSSDSEASRLGRIDRTAKRSCVKAPLVEVTSNSSQSTTENSSQSQNNNYRETVAEPKGVSSGVRKNITDDQPNRLRAMLARLGHVEGDRMASVKKITQEGVSPRKQDSDSSPEFSMLKRTARKSVKSNSLAKSSIKEPHESRKSQSSHERCETRPDKQSQESKDSQGSKDSGGSKDSQESKDSRKSRNSVGSAISYVIEDSSPDMAAGTSNSSNQVSVKPDEDDLALLDSPVRTRLTNTASTKQPNRKRQRSLDQMITSAYSKTSTPIKKTINTNETVSEQSDNMKSVEAIKNTAGPTADQAPANIKNNSKSSTPDVNMHAFVKIDKLETARRVTASPRSAFTRPDDQMSQTQKNDMVFPSTQPFIPSVDESPNSKETHTEPEALTHAAGESVQIGDGDHAFPCTQPFTISNHPDTQGGAPTPKKRKLTTEEVETFTQPFEIAQPFVALEDISKHSGFSSLSTSLNAGKESQETNKSSRNSQQSAQSSVLFEVPMAHSGKRRHTESPVLETQTSGSSVEFICETFASKSSHVSSEDRQPSLKSAPLPTCLPTSSQIEAGHMDSQFAKPIGCSTQVADNVLPVTESDEQFRAAIMSDSYFGGGDDPWPCSTPPITPADTLPQAIPQTRAKEMPPPFDLSPKLSQNGRHKVEQSQSDQLSWSTLDLNTQKSNQLSGNSSNGPEDQCDQNQALDGEETAMDTPKDSEVIGFRTRAKKIGGEKSSKTNIEDNANAKPPVSRKRDASPGSGDVFVLSASAKKIIDGQSEAAKSPSVQMDVDIVNRSWSEQSDTCTPTKNHQSPTVTPPPSPKRKLTKSNPGPIVIPPPSPKQRSSKTNPSPTATPSPRRRSTRSNPSPALTPPARPKERPTKSPPSPTLSPPPSPRRKSTLLDVISQPLREPTFEDAKSTMSQETDVYADARSALSEESFTSAIGEAAGPSEAETCKLGKDESTSVVKSEPLSRRAVTSADDALNVISLPQASTSKCDEQPKAVLFIKKCESCQSGKNKVECKIDSLKSHSWYSRLMTTYRIEDGALLGYVVALSADWEVVDQYFQSGGHVGKLWTEKFDRLLTSPFHKKRNKQQLKKRFSEREITNRKKFLLQYIDLNTKQREALLGMSSTTTYQPG